MFETAYQNVRDGAFILASGIRGGASRHVPLRLGESDKDGMGTTTLFLALKNPVPHVRRRAVSALRSLIAKLTPFASSNASQSGVSCSRSNAIDVCSSVISDDFCGVVSKEDSVFARSSLLELLDDEDDDVRKQVLGLPRLRVWLSNDNALLAMCQRILVDKVHYLLGMLCAMFL